MNIKSLKYYSLSDEEKRKVIDLVREISFKERTSTNGNYFSEAL